MTLRKLPPSLLPQFSAVFFCLWHLSGGVLTFGCQLSGKDGNRETSFSRRSHMARVAKRWRWCLWEKLRHVLLMIWKQTLSCQITVCELWDVRAHSSLLGSTTLAGSLPTHKQHGGGLQCSGAFADLGIKAYTWKVSPIHVLCIRQWGQSLCVWVFGVKFELFYLLMGDLGKLTCQLRTFVVPCIRWWWQ